MNRHHITVGFGSCLYYHVFYFVIVTLLCFRIRLVLKLPSGFHRLSSSFDVCLICCLVSAWSCSCSGQVFVMVLNVFMVVFNKAAHGFFKLASVDVYYIDWTVRVRVNCRYVTLLDLQEIIEKAVNIFFFFFRNVIWRVIVFKVLLQSKLYLSCDFKSKQDIV